MKAVPMVIMSSDPAPRKAVRAPEATGSSRHCNFALCADRGSGEASTAAAATREQIKNLARDDIVLVNDCALLLEGVDIYLLRQAGGRPNLSVASSSDVLTRRSHHQRQRVGSAPSSRSWIFKSAFCLRRIP